MEAFALWTSAEAAHATQGTSDGFWTASGVSIDSRSVAFGDLFVALRGPNFDGHVFVADALAKGAAAAMVDRVPETLPPGANLLIVKDTFQALYDLAAAARQRCGAKVIAVTGSVGKTSTKEMLRHVLSEQGATHATTGNLNNHWGVPLTLARMPVDSRFAVIEMGMNHPGEIEPLSKLARPHIGVITAIEAVHLENFKSIDGIADAKAEIFAGFEPGGTAILNRDNPHFERVAAAARAAGAAEIIGFGEHPEAQARLVKYAPHSACSCVAAEILGHPLTFKIGAPGRHWVLNALAVLAAVQRAGGDLAEAGLALARITAPKGRGERHTVEWRDGGSIDVIDDSYNASPPSMRAAFSVLAMAKPSTPRGRRIAVLGDMLELGPDEQAAHNGLAEDLVREGIDLVFACGPLMRGLYEALPAQKRGHHAPNSIELIQPLRRAIRSGDVLLVKGSLGSRMGKIVEDLLTAPPQPRAANGW
ncbi:UDP-N-acetylmuramoylalanyl-D-glutamyl-2,6-diaminopimelate--D-alanyl-D-alanine ligase [uncultured Ferrovibrio sp.]|jgi:UDP-N-acetylmuramoyl-tripeptide--D-alanyl-D-alanine ligase|uniref:UDP-N-acetylmuramoylalanyl-D-glutamyl-2, 6-diaminopimelate--D-alanyl-D-alanine ligase n=1 Tax=uncultured Ferrovibrio sp. TaxID=1576913 RepID=UPI0026367F02|nr:UDP-N-acetylmuramoylalanyl-D-glutamyl-2,6-diaminopimelate--D-alanyl-D-alanine ligase [uncultured Ferrovibrio sp.]